MSATIRLRSCAAPIVTPTGDHTPELSASSHGAPAASHQPGSLWETVLLETAVSWIRRGLTWTLPPRPCSCRSCSSPLRGCSSPLAVVGDFNITRDDRDVHDPEWWRGRILCSDKERDAMDSVMAFGLDDSFRQHHEDAGIYTWWHYTGGAAMKNDGLRIDYVLSSKSASKKCTDVIVHRDERSKKSPSDHVPVTAIYTDNDA